MNETTERLHKPAVAVIVIVAMEILNFLSLFPEDTHDIFDGVAALESLSERVIDQINPCLPFIVLQC
jgi:hypothetical protein